MELNMHDYYIEDTKWLKTTDDIEGFFSEDPEDYFECGQGYSQDVHTTFAKIGEQFYEVTMTAELGSAKQDRGDRLYWVEEITSVTHKPVETIKVMEIIRDQITATINQAKADVAKAEALLVEFDEMAGIQ